MDLNHRSALYNLFYFYFLAYLLILILALFGIVTCDWLINGRSFIPYPHRLIPNISLFGSIVLAMAITALLNKINVVSSFGQKMHNKALMVIASYFGSRHLCCLGAVPE